MESKLNKDILDQINNLKLKIDAHGVIDVETLKKINYKFRLEWNYFSNHMEGNTLTMQETRSIMIGNISVKDKSLKEVVEMTGHDEVIKKIIAIGKSKLNLSESRIKEIHKAIIYSNPSLDSLDSVVIGNWKKIPNYTYYHKGEKFEYLHPAEVPEKMHQLLNWLNAEKEKIERQAKSAIHPLDLASQFHLDFLTIHPFEDGNGRMARILSNLILISYGYPPIYIQDAEKEIYYNYLGDIQAYGGNPDLIFNFFGELLIRSLKIIDDALNSK